MNISDILNTNLPRIAVLFGGCSSEYQVSLSSGSAVLKSIDTSAYMPVPVGITREGAWFVYTGDYDNIPSDRWMNSQQCYPIYFSGQQSSKGFLVSLPGDDALSMRLTPMWVRAALPILHGQNGEDGTVQGLLALLGIPVIGCGILCSSLCMDKELAHRMADALHILVPSSFSLFRNTGEEAIYQAAEALTYPLFVKPARAGSSFGITCVQERDQLLAAVENAFLYDTKVLLEEKINGFEVGCAIIGRNFFTPDQLLIGDVDEIELTEGFFDYTEKYTLKTSRIHVPARITSKKAQEIKDTAARLFLGLDCDFFARIDLFLTPSGEIYFNEINTIPGFTSHSRFPGMLKNRGFDFSSLVNHLIEMEVGHDL